MFAWDTILIGAFLLVGTMIRIYLNSLIYNELHDENKELFVHADTIDEVDDSAESGLFFLYCLVVLIWIKYKRSTIIYALFSNTLGLLSVAALYYLVTH